MMKKWFYRTNIVTSCLCLMVMLAACGDSGDPNKIRPARSSRTDVLPYYNESTFTPVWPDQEGFDSTALHTVSDFTLINQNGDTLNRDNFAGKVYVTDFFFTTCPGICPKMTDNMAILQKAFREEDKFLLLSHSVTPVTDSVPMLRAYADQKGVIDDKWHLVTGEREEIYRLGRRVYFVEEDLGEMRTADEFLHTENFVLVDQSGHLRGIYNGLNRSAIDQLIADAKLLLAKDG